MRYSGISRKAGKTAVFIALPVCIFATVLFRSPANAVITADMPGGTSRYSNKSREVRTLSEYVHGETGVQKNGFFAKDA
ncbi:hypothetical protein NB640_03085 [Oxalobacter vibrioformis]|uniref:Uncharacterized protein n=1 Tax=Oxalobacter vibrioformis TaxID=933080 RepID=A0A9E9LYD7_9BURK|nr:hypothetical protein [Oxalobacter vibrioformis]NLC23930.1 hypothetical protein [Oxalobacter sp.]WAW10661.1 hypothetical protein NB640_03085 [Oxalobacter vibrioformis]